MRLRDIEFGRVWGASGVQGFFGEGYWFHRVFQRLGLSFKNVTFVAKTTTLKPRAGNMPLKADFTPKELFPKCIVVKPLAGVVLNSVGLSGPGAVALFEKGLWQQRRNPFFISFMSTAGSPSERIEELREFVALFERHLPAFNAPVGLQMNYSCPNVGLHAEELVGEVEQGLTVASKLGIPLVPKFNLFLPVKTACRIAEHPGCDAICISNTIPWGGLPRYIDWQGIFGTSKSPIHHLGGGGLSGAPLLPPLLEWICQARKARLRKLLNAGGGINSKRKAREVLKAGADSIFIGTVSMTRPWRVKGIVSSAMNSH